MPACSRPRARTVRGDIQNLPRQLRPTLTAGGIAPLCARRPRPQGAAHNAKALHDFLRVCAQKVETSCETCDRPPAAPRRRELREAVQLDPGGEDRGRRNTTAMDR